MPHIIVEHSNELNIDIKNLNKNLHQCLSEQDTVNLASIKTRSIAVNNVIVGSGENNNFIHINILLLPGRSDALKKKMAENIYKTANNLIEKELCLLSVNITDLGIYVK